MNQTIRTQDTESAAVTALGLFYHRDDAVKLAEMLNTDSGQINIIIGITWAFVLPYLFGICSELDKSGQMVALGGFASKMGLASGPMVAALMLHGENYQQVINFAVVGLVLCAIVVFKPARRLDIN
jgi:hypothetical protein